MDGRWHIARIYAGIFGQYFINKKTLEKKTLKTRVLFFKKLQNIKRFYIYRSMRQIWLEFTGNRRRYTRHMRWKRSRGEWTLSPGYW